jgi:hypothetical protein
MVHPEWLRDEEILMVRPDDELTERDFEHMARIVDPVIERRGRLEGLLIDARGFEGWDDSKALMAHLRFVKGHVDKVARIAVIGDQWWLNAAEAIIDPAFGTPVRVFLAKQADEARAWLLDRAPEPRTVEVLPESGAGRIGIRVTGRLREADYDDLLGRMAAALPESGKLDMLVELAPGFRGWTPRAFFEDLALAVSPWRRRFRRVALIAQPGFLRWFAGNFPSALIPYEFRVFEPSEKADAWAWLAEPDNTGGADSGDNAEGTPI